jgi:protein-disulfide isomerase
MKRTKSEAGGNFLKENFLAVSILSSAVIIGVSLIIAFGPNISFNADSGLPSANNAGSDQQAGVSAIDVASLKKAARNLGADGKKFDSCLDSGKFASAIQSDISQGSTAGIGGTPSFFINNEIRIIGAQPYTTFANVIDAKLNGTINSLNLPTCISTQPTSEEEMNAYYGPCKVNVSINVDGNPVEGDQGAPVTMVTFSDYECPYCKNFAVQTLSQIRTNYVDAGKVKVVFKDFPLEFHANAQKAAEAARCMRDQLGDEGYWKMHDAIFGI